MIGRPAACRSAGASTWEVSRACCVVLSRLVRLANWAIAWLWIAAFVAPIVVAVGPPLLAWLAPEAEWSYRWQNALDSELADAVVTVAHQPHDCEFLTAPLGSKHCHYERHVDIVRVRGAASDRHISYDNGKQWSLATATDRPAIIVSWTKVDD